jgi:hypothetical protein
MNVEPIAAYSHHSHPEEQPEKQEGRARPTGFPVDRRECPEQKEACGNNQTKHLG